MDQNSTNNNENNNEEIAYPFQLMPSETSFHLYKNIKVKLIGQNDKEIVFFPENGNVLITNERVCWYIDQIDENTLEEEVKIKISSIKNQENNKQTILSLCGKSFMFQYENLVSHGQQGDNFMCFLGSQEEEEMELEDEQEALEELAQQKNSSEIIDLGKGEYQISFYIQSLSVEVKEQFISIFTELATANVEIEDEGDDYLDEMITADNIDKDGNIIIQKQNNVEEEDNDEDYEDCEDEDDDDQNDENEQDEQNDEKNDQFAQK